MKKTEAWRSQRSLARAGKRNRRRKGTSYRPSMEATTESKEKSQLGMYAQMLQNTIRISRIQGPADNKYKLRQKIG